jgi:trk system potassium uptake protein TrkH
MRRFGAVLHIFSLVMLLFGTTMLVPLGLSWWLRDGAELAYDEAFVLSLLSGALVWVLTRRFKREAQPWDGFLLVVLVWLVLPAMGAIPLYVHLPALSFTDAYFEAVSGLTATGATVLSGLDYLPASINFWRHQLHWMGGLGVIVLAVAILPMLGIGGRQLLKAETPGPMKDTRLTPRIAETAKGLWLVYGALTLACLLAYHLAGMSWLDAIMHAFSTVALGGFSTTDASLGHFDSLAIELIAIFFALLAGMNFATHFLAWRQKSLVAYLRDHELPYYLLVLGASSLFIAWYIWIKGVYPDFFEALRHSAFHTVSVATSLGMATEDYAQWPYFVPFWMLFLGSFAVCSGSTGGGIKMMRAIILYKQVFREFIRAIHPSAIHPVRLGRAALSGQILFAVLAFAFLYMVSIVSLTLILSATELDIITAFSAIVACLNNTGPGLGAVGPASNFGILTDFQTWICSFTMLLGRLEIFTLLVVLNPTFWKA